MKKIIYIIFFISACSINNANKIKVHYNLNNNFYLGEDIENRKNYSIWYLEKADSIESDFWDDYYKGISRYSDSLFYNDSLIVVCEKKRYLIINTEKLSFKKMSYKKFNEYVVKHKLSEIIKMKKIEVLSATP